MSRILEKYREEVSKKMMEKYGYKNKLEVPKIKKIVINMGVGEAKQDAKALDDAMVELALISGQKPIVTRAKRSIASFNVRKGMQIGCKVTLRRKRMYDFFDKLVNIAIPRIKDFRVLNDNSFDERGNYTLGIKEQDIFPEINYEQVKKIRGMNISIQTTAKNPQEAKDLLRFLGMPFSNR